MTTEADRLVERWLLLEFRHYVADDGSPLGAISVTIGKPTNDPAVTHLAECPQAAVSAVDNQGLRLWDTGVTGVEVGAEVTCPHSGVIVDLNVDLMGTFSDVIEELDRIKASLGEDPA